MVDPVSLPGERLRPEELEALVHNDFATFVQVMFNELNPGRRMSCAPYLSLLASKLEDVAHGRCKRLIITLPPRLGKSFATSVALPAYVLGHYPDQDIMAVSYGADLAKELARQTAVLMASERYRAIFGDVLLAKRQSPMTLRTVSNGVRRATSIDGAATGMGGDLIVFDDPQKPGETLSDKIRKATNSAFENTFASRGNKASETRIVIVMQRLHEDDFVGHVLGLGDDWRVLNFPAIAEVDEEIAYRTPWGSQTYRRKAGEALHPDRLSVEDLERLRRTLGEYAYAAQYQQRPAPSGGGIVQTSWFGRYNQERLPDTFERIIQSWDTASKANSWHDFSVCTTWGVKGEKIFLLNVFRERLIYPDLKVAVQRLQRDYRATEVHIEDKGSGTQLIQDLRRENLGEIREVTPVNDKATRMFNQTEAIKNGNVLVPEDAPWLGEFLYELAVFPNGRFDDQVDSVSQALQAWRSYGPGMNVVQFYREQFERFGGRKPAKIIALRPADPAPSHLYDIEGHMHVIGADGLFRVSEKVVPLIPPGWTRVDD